MTLNQLMTIGVGEALLVDFRLYVYTYVCKEIFRDFYSDAVGMYGGWETTDGWRDEIKHENILRKQTPNAYRFI